MGKVRKMSEVTAEPMKDFLNSMILLNVITVEKMEAEMKHPPKP